MPGWILVPAVVGGVFILLPLAAMLARVQWSQFWELITSESSVAALWLSLKTSTASTILCVVVGTPMALVLARATFPGLRLARSLVLLPLAPLGIYLGVWLNRRCSNETVYRAANVFLFATGIKLVHDGISGLF